MDVEKLTDNEFIVVLRRQAVAVFLATEEPVARDLANSLLHAAKRIEDLQRQDALAQGER